MYILDLLVKYIRFNLIILLNPIVSHGISTLSNYRMFDPDFCKWFSSSSLAIHNTVHPSTDSRSPRLADI